MIHRCRLEPLNCKVYANLSQTNLAFSMFNFLQFTNRFLESIEILDTFKRGKHRQYYFCLLRTLETSSHILQTSPKWTMPWNIIILFSINDHQKFNEIIRRWEHLQFERIRHIFCLVNSAAFLSGHGNGCSIWTALSTL